MRANANSTIQPTNSPAENVADVPAVPVLAENAIRKVTQPKRELYNYLRAQFAKGASGGGLKPGGRVIPKSQMVKP